MPLDLTDYTANMQIRRTADSETADATLTTENGKITIDAEAGKVTWVLSAAETAALEGEYVYEIEIINADEEPSTILKGKITVSPEVAR